MKAISTSVLSALAGIMMIPSLAGTISGSKTIDGDLTITIDENASSTTGIAVNNGERVDLAPQAGNAVVTINISDGFPNASGITAMSGGVVDIGKLLLNASGANMALRANGDTSSISIGDGSEIKIEQQNHFAITSQNGAEIRIGDNAKISGTSASYLVSADDNATIVIGDHATLSNLDSTGQQRTLAALRGSTFIVGTNAVIINMSDKATIDTEGLEAVTVRQNGTGTIGAEANILNTLVHGYGIAARESNSSLTIGENSTITTTGNNGFGVLAQDGGTVILKSESHIETSGTGAYGLYSFFSNKYLSSGSCYIETGDGVRITTYGVKGYAVSGLLKNANGETSIIKLGKNNVIRTEGDEGHGIMAYTGARIEADDGLDIKTLGTYAYGVWSYGQDSSVILGDNTRIVTSGDWAYGLLADVNNASINAGSGLDIDIQGDGMIAVYANRGGQIELRDSTIKTNDGSYALYASTTDANTSRITGSGVFDITGIIATAAGAEIDLNLKSGSLFTGSTTMIRDTQNALLNMTMTGSTWKVMQSSRLSNLSANDSSQLLFTIANYGDYTQIATDLFSFYGSSVINVSLQDDFSPVEGSMFQLVLSDVYDISADTLFDFSLALLAEGLAWYTGEFDESGALFVIKAPVTDPDPDPEPGTDPDPENPDPGPGTNPDPGPGEEIIKSLPELDGSHALNSLWTTLSNVHTLRDIALGQVGVRRHHLDPQNNFWATGIGEFSHHRTSKGRRGYDYTGWGYAVGSDTPLGESAVIGIAFGNLHGTNKSRDFAIEIKQESLLGLLYGQWDHQIDEKQSISVQGALSWGETDNVQKTWYSDGNRSRGKWKNHIYFADLQGNWNIELSESLVFSPMMGIEFAAAKQRQFTESGDKVRHFDNAHLRTLTLPVGAGLTKLSIIGNDIKWINGISASYLPDVYRKNPQAGITRLKNGSTWTGYGVKPSRHAFRIDYTTRMVFSPSWSAMAGYTFEGRNKAILHNCHIGASYTF